MKKIILFLLCIVPLISLCQQDLRYPKQVDNVLKKAGKNRDQLVQAITYFENSKDPLKLKAVYFLIANMDIHYSADYFWADSAGKRIVFNELEYADHNQAVEAFEVIKTKHKGIHPQAFTYFDVDSIKANFLIENVELAFKYWQNPRIKGLPFDDFCEYVLPYRVSVEPLQDWRKKYQDKFAFITDSAKGKSIEQTLHFFANDMKSWFTNTWQVEERKEPLPRLGPLQLLSRAKGNCEDIAGLEVYTLRSQGYPAAVDHIPLWGTTAGMHYFNNTIDEQLKPLPFDASLNTVKINNFAREPSKVLRETYSKQSTALASFTNASDIPRGFMRNLNYLDVTSAHWETKELNCELIKNAPPSGLAFACVFNGGKWLPTWWGKVKGTSVGFNNMAKGIVYLPAYYVNEKLRPAGYPVVLGYQQEIVLKPDTLNKRTVKVNQQDKYLIFRPGKKYKLYCWTNGWKFYGEQVAFENATALTFEGIPDKALMLLLPEYSVGKERPFTIDAAGLRQWW